MLLDAAHAVARRVDPYGIRVDGSLPSLVDRFFYPLPAVLLGAPFVWLSVQLAAICFAACAGFALLFAITRDGFERVPIVLSIPFIVAAKIAQTTPSSWRLRCFHPSPDSLFSNQIWQPPFSRVRQVSLHWRLAPCYSA